jgi:SNF2 family DNA or RNA helicase
MREQQSWKKRKHTAISMDALHMREFLVEEDPLIAGFGAVNVECSAEKIKRVCLQMKKKQKTKPKPLPQSVQPSSVILKQPYTLLPHQTVALKWIADREIQSRNGISGGIVSLEMGLGKTLVALATIKSRSGMTPTLFVCNKSLIGSITQDCVKFFGSSMTYKVVHPDYMDSVAMDACAYGGASWCNGTDFILITYDTLVSICKKGNLLKTKQKRKHDTRKNTFFNIRWHRVIADESQRFVNPKSQIFRALSCILPSFRLCLTGTPIRNYDYDLFTQLMFCGLSPAVKWTAENYKRLNIIDSILLMSMKDAKIHLPAKHVVQIQLTFDKREKAIYDLIFQRSRQKFTAFSNGNTAFADVLIMFLRLRQACISSHLIAKDVNSSDDDGWLAQRELSGFQSTKFLKTVEILRNIPVGEKLLIFSSFTSALSILKDSLKSNGFSALMVTGSTTAKKRDILFEFFRTSKDTNILLLTNTVGSMGLNLTEANHVILLEPWWNVTTSSQAIARCHRIGQQKEVYVWELVIRGSIEDKMLKMCATKSTISDQFLSKEVIKNIFN